MELWSRGEVRPNEQDVVVRMRRGNHLGRRRVQRAGSVDLLKAGVLLGGPVGADPETRRGAGGATVDVTPEDDGTGARAT